VLFSLLSYGSASLRRTERLCRERGIAIVAYNVLGQGLLTDRLTRANFSSFRAAKMFRGITFSRLEKLRETIRSVANECGNADMAQVCINWAICKCVIPLIGLRTPHQARQACAAFANGWRLSPEVCAIVFFLFFFF
jgi:pyridoxine 4-dehydrogenase